MAACTFAVGTADTGVTPNTSGSFSPASGDLLVGLVVVSASASADSTLTSSIGGFTFSRIIGVTYNAGVNLVVTFVSDALVSDTSAQTVTWDGVSDQGNGSVIFVYRVSGMTKTGLTAVLQSDSDFNVGA